VPWHRLRGDGWRRAAQRYPVLEDLRLRELGAEDEGVEARLVDDGLVWVSLNTVTNRYGILILVVNVVAKSLAWVGISKGCCDICSHEPRLPTFSFPSFHPPLTVTP